MLENLSRIRLFALDVDGTLTDGSVYYDDAGREYKQFHTQDGLGMVLAGIAGLQIAWITGRQSPIVERRATELHIPFLMQGVRDKGTALREIMTKLGITSEETAFMGDDLNDLPAFRACGVTFAPSSAVPEVRHAAAVVTERAGGDGAAREAIERVLHAQGTYHVTVERYLASLIPMSFPFPVH